MIENAWSVHRHVRVHVDYFSDRRFQRAAVASLSLLLFGVALNFYAGVYATVRASNYVDDVVLSNIPVFQVEWLFVGGTFILAAITAVVVLSRPQWIPFSASALGLFYALRAIFISVTHLGPFPDRIDVVDWGTVVAKFIGGADFFFSGHTGAPFLLALVFWHVRSLRYFFLAWSFLFAVTVLLGHVHYTVDVLSAYFITYAIFHIGEHLFSTYRALFYEGLPGLEKSA